MQTAPEMPAAAPQAAAAEDVAAEAEQAVLASPVDPLPTPEEIAEAAVASASATCRPSSAVGDSTTETALKGLGKGLGGAGLARRKAKGGGSTISAATAPAVLAVRNKKGGGAAEAPRASAMGGSTATGAAAEDSGKTGKVPLLNASGGDKSGDSSRVPNKGGDQRLGLNMSAAAAADDAADDNADEDVSGEWESASTDEEVSQLLASAGNAATVSATTAPRTAATATSSTSRSTSNSNTAATWKQVLYDVFDETTLFVCGAVLGLCAGSLLVLGATVQLNR